MDEDAVAGRVGARLYAPSRTTDGGAAQLSACGAEGADAVGEVFAVGVADRQYRDVGDTVVIGVGDRGCGERLASLSDGRVLVFPARGADLLAGVDVASAQTRERVAVGWISLSTIAGQCRDGNALVGGDAREFGEESAGGDRLCLVGVTDTPECASGARATMSRSAPAWRVLSCDTSSTMTVVPARTGSSRTRVRKLAVVCAARPADWSSPTALCVVASTTTSRPAARWASAAACSAVVLPNPAGAANTRTDAPSPHSTRTASAWSTPNGLGVTTIACSTSVSSMELAGLAINCRNVPRTWSSTARCSTVDHSAGRRRWASGTSRTTNAESKNRRDTSTIWFDVEAAA